VEQVRPAGDISIGIPTPPSCDLDRDLIGTKPVLKCSAWTGVQQNPACGGSNGLACALQHAGPIGWHSPGGTGLEQAGGWRCRR
jgi:hypothetical protein